MRARVVSVDYVSDVMIKLGSEQGCNIDLAPVFVQFDKPTAEQLHKTRIAGQAGGTCQ